jgi:tetrahydromethanopterin S-methyltransferase subunit G
MEDQTPVFVKIDEYKDVLSVLDLIKTKLSQARTTLNKINEIKDKEDLELQVWKHGLEELEKKVEYVDNKLLHPSGL